MSLVDVAGHPQAALEEFSRREHEVGGAGPRHWAEQRRERDLTG